MPDNVALLVILFLMPLCYVILLTVNIAGVKGIGDQKHT